MFTLKVDDEIEIRPYILEDAEELSAIVRANCEHLQTFLQWAVPEYSTESAKEFIEQSQKASAEKKREGFGIFCSDKLIGSIGFNKFDWDGRKTEIGYWIAKDYSGKGIITRVCKTLINYAFYELKMNRVEIRCATENIRSSAIPERLGFKLEGVLRQALWRHAKLYDEAIYGLLKEEWRK